MKKILKNSLYALFILGSSFNNMQADEPTVTDSSKTKETVNVEPIVNTDKKIDSNIFFKKDNNLLKNKKWQKKSEEATTPVAKTEVAPEMPNIYQNAGNPDDESFEYVAKEYPLIAAAKRNDLEAVLRLIKDNTIEINRRDLKGKTAYDYALANSKKWNIPSQRQKAKLIANLVTYSIKEVD